MFKKFCITFVFAGCCILGFSQSTTPSVIGVGGGSVTEAGYRIDYNIGELAIQTAGSGPIITEGFEQPEMGDVSLPVLGLKLRLSQENNHAILSFSTVQEFKTDYFIAERSIDGLHFDTLTLIKTKAPNGNSTVPLYYTYTDPTPLEATVYYRIDQVDQNGANIYSTVESINRNAQEGLKVYPNPATSQITVKLEKPFADTRIQVYSASGVLMYNQILSAKAATTIQLNKWPAGIYLMEVYMDGVTHKTKFFKK